MSTSTLVKSITIKDIAKYPIAVLVACLMFYYGKSSNRNDNRCDVCERKLDSVQNEQVKWLRAYIHSETENKTLKDIQIQRDSLQRVKIIEPAKKILEKIENDK